METSIKDVELWLITTCKEIDVGVSSGDDDFFDSGGTSLGAIRLIDYAEQAYGEDCLPPELLFERSRIDQIAQTIFERQV